MFVASISNIYALVLSSFICIFVYDPICNPQKSGSGTATGRALFAILVSDSDDIPLDEGTAAGQDWDSSTVSSDKISSNDVLDQVYYKTSSGFSVRI